MQLNKKKSATTERIKIIKNSIKYEYKYKLIIKKKKKHDKKAKSKLNIIEVLISKALIDSNISNDEMF